jgi:siderophore synthetase component
MSDNNTKTVSLIPTWVAALRIVGIIVESRAQRSGKVVAKKFREVSTLVEETFMPLCQNMDTLIEGMEQGRLEVTCTKCSKAVNANFECACPKELESGK